VHNLDITEGSSKVFETLYTADQEPLDRLLDAYGIFTHSAHFKFTLCNS